MATDYADAGILQGRADLGRDRQHQLRSGRDRLRPARTVLCNRRLFLGGVLPGTAKAGVCAASLCPLCFGKGSRWPGHGADDRDLLHLRQRSIRIHEQHRRRCHDHPAEIVSAIEDVGFLQSIPLWLVSFLGSLLITVLSFILILTVYGCFFKLYIYTAISPLPFASFAGENTAGIGKAFVKSYIGVCLEGAVIVLACLIYSAFLSSGSPVVDSSLPAVTMAWEYIGELVFNMLVLTGLVKGADRIVREMFSL